MRFWHATPYGFCRPGVRAFAVGETPPLRFSARYDTLTWGITLGVMILLAAVSMALLLSPIEPLLKLGFVGLMIAITLASYTLSPRGFILAEDHLIIRRIIRSVRIPYSSIAEVRYDPTLWSWVRIRLCGSGGMFGFWGLFQLRKLGRAWLYVTNRRNLVLIRTKEGKVYLISPENPTAFVDSIQLKLNTRKALNSKK